MPIEILERRFKIRGSFTFSRVSGRTSRFVRIPMKSRLIRVEAKFKNVEETWYRSGYLNHIHNGIRSKGIVIKFGIQLIVMPDSLPYTLEFSPVSWLPDGYLRISEYLLPLSNEELIQLSLDSPNPPSLSTIIQLFTDIMSTDLRQQKIAIAAVKAEVLAAQDTANNALTIGQVAQDSANNAQGSADSAMSAVQLVSGTVQTLSGEMVRKFTSQPIEAVSFVFDPVRNYYYATVSHLLGDLAPDVEVYDNDKDKQRIQSIIVDLNTIELELDGDDLTNNSFPLTCIVFGKTEPVS